jgi:hypothetical protein
VSDPCECRGTGAPRCLLCQPAECLALVNARASATELASIQADYRRRGTAIAHLTPDRTLTWIPIDQIVLITTPHVAGEIMKEARRRESES